MSNPLPFPAPPSVPVDGYTVRWFQLETLSWGKAWISECRAEYHLSTPWTVFRPDGSRGVDLVDDWMLYSNGQASGRCCGWASFPGRRTWETCYTTRAAAEVALLAWYTAERERARETERTLDRRLQDAARQIAAGLPLDFF